MALESIVASLRVIHQTLGTARTLVSTDDCERARSFALQARECFHRGLQELFKEQLTMETLRRRELLRRVDVIGLRANEAVDAILDGIVKRAA